MASYEKALSTPLTAKHSSFLKEATHDQDRVESLPHYDKGVDESYGSVPTQKYTMTWFKATWNDAIRVGKWPRIFYCLLGFIFIVGWVGIMLGLVGIEVKDEQQNAKAIAHRKGDHQGRNRTAALTGLPILKGSLVNFDVEKRALTVTWSGLWFYNETEEPVEFGDEKNNNSVTFADGIEIYRDLSSWPYNATYKGTDDNQTYWEWAYQTDNATAKPIGVIGVHTWDSFDTDITFSQRFEKDAWVQPLLGYPLDQWQGEIVFVANDRWLSNFYNISGGGVMDIAGIQLADGTLNWKFDFSYEDKCGPDQVNANYSTNDISTLPHDCHLAVTFIGRRPPLLIFCAIAAVAVNWTCALFIFILTCEAIVMRRSYMLQGTDILSMCFTALFALPTIRSLLPGAPAYGAIIDLVGILPCTIIVGLCAVCVSVAKLNKRYRGQKDE